MPMPRDNRKQSEMLLDLIFVSYGHPVPARANDNFQDRAVNHCYLCVVLHKSILFLASQPGALKASESWETESQSNELTSPVRGLEN